jgi:hypothetical protein
MRRRLSAKKPGISANTPYRSQHGCGCCRRLQLTAEPVERQAKMPGLTVFQEMKLSRWPIRARNRRCASIAHRPDRGDRGCLRCCGPKSDAGVRPPELCSYCLNNRWRWGNCARALSRPASMLGRPHGIECQLGLSFNQDRTPVTQIKRIGIDTSKAVFTLHCTASTRQISRCCVSIYAAPRCCPSSKNTCRPRSPWKRAPVRTIGRVN